MSSSAERSVPGGFVLLEAVVALAIIGLVAVALLSAAGAQVRAAERAEVLLVARSLAEDRLGALRLLEYDALADPPDSLRAGRFPAPFEMYEWSAVVEEVEQEYDLFAAEVVVTGQGHRYPLRTLVHRPRPVVVTES